MIIKCVCGFYDQLNRSSHLRGHSPSSRGNSSGCSLLHPQRDYRALLAIKIICVWNSKVKSDQILVNLLIGYSDYNCVNWMTNSAHRCRATIDLKNEMFIHFIDIIRIFFSYIPTHVQQKDVTRYLLLSIEQNFSSTNNKIECSVFHQSKFPMNIIVMLWIHLAEHNQLCSCAPS